MLCFSSASDWLFVVQALVKFAVDAVERGRFWAQMAVQAFSALSVLGCGDEGKQKPVSVSVPVSVPVSVSVSVSVSGRRSNVQN